MLLNHFLHVINSRSTNTNPKPFPIDFLPYTNMAQNQIGFNLFIKGALDCKWQRIQEKYISQERFTKQYNIRRWIQRVAELLLNHCVAQYKERCNIINAENQHVFEHSNCTKIYELLMDVKSNPWKIPIQYPISMSGSRILLQQLTTIIIKSKKQHLTFECFPRDKNYTAIKK